MTTKDDGKVDIELDLEDDLLFELMIRAHQQDITLNQMIENILTRVIEERKNAEIQPEST